MTPQQFAGRRNYRDAGIDRVDHTNKRFYSALPAQETLSR